MTTSIETKIQEMKAQAQAQVQAKMEQAKLAAAEKLYSSERFLELMAEQAIKEETSTAINELELACKSIVEDNPIFNPKMKQNRTWNPSKRFGFGSDIANLMGLLSGIQYSVSEHRNLMISITNLTESLIEQTLNALGTQPYYSTNHHTVVEGTRGNASELVKCLTLVEATLGIQLDKSLVTQERMDRQFDLAQLRANNAKDEAEAGDALEQFVLV